MSHNKDVLVSEYDAERKGIMFSSNSHWSRTRLQRQYRISNRRLPSVTNSFIGDTGGYTQREVSAFDRVHLNLSDKESAIVVTENGSSGTYGTLVILTEVDHVT